MLSINRMLTTRAAPNDHEGLASGVGRHLKIRSARETAPSRKHGRRGRFREPIAAACHAQDAMSGAPRTFPASELPGLESGQAIRALRVRGVSPAKPRRTRSVRYQDS